MKKRLKLVLSLRDEPFFHGMSEAVIARIENLVHHREYEPRQIIYFPDDPCDHVYWVREGRVRVARVADDKRELTFRHLFPGDMLGEECFVDRGKRGAQAEAMMTSILCLMSARDFRRIAREEKELSYAVARRLCERVHEVEQVLSETVFKTVRGRIASGLFRLYQAVPQGGQSGIRVTHQEIANLAGSTRETTTVVLHSFREEGILDIANRRVTVLDPLALEHAARSG